MSNELGLLNGLLILVIEDQAIIRMSIVEALEEQGAAVESVDAIEIALNALETLPFDFILSNTRIQNQDGYQFIREWRYREIELGKRPIPAIALSGHSSRELERSAIAAGFQAYFCKPLDLDLVVDAIVGLLKLQP